MGEGDSLELTETMRVEAQDGWIGREDMFIISCESRRF
jgi:hypothetical protein